MYSSLISVSISAKLRACVWNVHYVRNIIFEEHSCIGTLGTGKYVFVANRNTDKNVFRSSWKVPLFLGRTHRNLVHVYRLCCVC